MRERMTTERWGGERRRCVGKRFSELCRPFGHDAFGVRDGNVELSKEAMRSACIDGGGRAIDLRDGIDVEKRTEILKFLLAVELDKDGLGAVRSLLLQSSLLLAGSDGYLGPDAWWFGSDEENMRSTEKRVINRSNVGGREGIAVDSMRERVSFAKDGKACIFTKDEDGALPLSQGSNRRRRCIEARFAWLFTEPGVSAMTKAE